MISGEKTRISVFIKVVMREREIYVPMTDETDCDNDQRKASRATLVN